MKSWHPLPTEIYSFVEQNPGTVLLESARPGSSCISRLFTAPRQIFEVGDLAELPALFSKIEAAADDGQFVAGYFSYECGQYFEPSAHLQPATGLLAWFGIYDRCVRFDHAEGVFLDPAPVFGERKQFGESVPTVVAERLRVDFTLDKEHFAERISEIHGWIRAGDVYQLNFTFPVQVQAAEEPAALYARLRTSQPVDYAAFLNCGSNRFILSLSPELFFRIDPDGESRRITTRPMKGTARRGRTTAGDREIAAWLHDDC